jgi:hypothetical protein
MNRKTALSTVIMFALCVAAIAPLAQVSAQTTQVQIGVNPGDTFKYKATYYWNSSDPTATIPASLIEENTTEYIEVTVKSVTGNTVTLGEVQHFTNGSDLTLPDEITAVGTTNQMSVLLYAANLNPGSMVLPLADLPYYTVNETESQPYPSGNRATNLLVTTQYNVDTNNDQNISAGDFAYIYSNRLFDRQTGILVQGYFEYGSATTEGEAYAYLYTLIDSNVWTVSGPSDGNNNNNNGTGALSFTTELIIIVAVVVVVVVAASLLLIRQRKKKPKIPSSA